MADHRIRVEIIGDGSRVERAAKSLREKLEGPRAVREIFASAQTLIDLLHDYQPRQPLEILDARDELQRKLHRLDEIRTGT